VPVTVDSKAAWIAQEGFLKVTTEMQTIPVSQQEIDTASTTLPEGTQRIEVNNDNLLAVSAFGDVVATWNWQRTRSRAIGSITGTAQQYVT